MPENAMNTAGAACKSSGTVSPNASPVGTAFDNSLETRVTDNCLSGLLAVESIAATPQISPRPRLCQR
jgi:hypothetical protein